jgi:transcriptional regulator with XRE-family HTH domain
MAKAPKKRKRTESRPASSQMAAAIGRAIQVVRTDRGWSRKEFAARTGLSYSYLSEIENGVKQPSSRTYAVIADALDVAPGALLYDAERRLTESDSGSGDEKLASLEPESEATSAGGEPTLSARRTLSIEQLEQAARHLASELPLTHAARAAPPTAPRDESGPRIERSRRVLDWLAGPLARRSSSGDSTPTAASPPRRGAASSGDRAAPMEFEDPLAEFGSTEPTVFGSAEPELGSAERDSNAESVEQFVGALLPLLGELSPEDRELVLDLARRLAQRESGS